MRSTAKATLRVRVNLAAAHLRAATNAARIAHRIETANQNAPFGPWFDEMVLSVPTSVIMAGAALEACANEVVQDILDGSTGLNCTKGCTLLLEDLKSDRSGNAMDKYRRLALLFDKPPDEGKLPWQNAKDLVLFRNSFMHFKPAWDDESGVHDSKLVQRLKKRVPIARAYLGRFQFPHGFMTYGCAKWSVMSVLVFSDYFSNLLGLKDRFVPFQQDLQLP
jgi:hypothetical protein